MKDRVYVCHTFYHVYIAAVKELNKPQSERGKATLVLSTMSNDFGDLKERAEKTRLFEAVYMFDEKEDISSEEVMKYHEDKGNLILNLLQRIKYTKMLGKLQEQYVPVDFKDFKDVYVFCDSDPIGYYLTYKKIRYHALEDGLNCIMIDDRARVSNAGHFELKAKLAAMGLIFIENGYAKYCIDMEVNNIECLPFKVDKYIEVPREKLIAGVAKEDKMTLLSIFIDNSEELVAQINEADKSKQNIMILSEPLCDLETRKRIFSDIAKDYCKGANIFIKPHPRDELDYENLIPGSIVIKGRFPMEVMNDIPGIHMDKLITIFTMTDAIHFADEFVRLGEDFMDNYEDPAIHRPHDLICPEHFKNLGLQGNTK